jgi:hypothetical protein
MATTLIEKKNIQSHNSGQYNYEDYSKTEAYKRIQVLEVIDVKKFKWEWTAPAINELGIHSYSKRTIKKYKFHELTISNC